MVFDRRLGLRGLDDFSPIIIVVKVYLLGSYCIVWLFNVLFVYVCMKLVLPFCSVLALDRLGVALTGFLMLSLRFSQVLSGLPTFFLHRRLSAADVWAFSWPCAAVWRWGRLDPVVETGFQQKKT